jgi:hypothetical protein
LVSCWFVELQGEANWVVLGQDMTVIYWFVHLFSPPTASMLEVTMD